jgi:hypothetical protein
LLNDLPKLFRPEYTQKGETEEDGRGSKIVYDSSSTFADEMKGVPKETVFYLHHILLAHLGFLNAPSDIPPLPGVMQAIPFK